MTAIGLHHLLFRMVKLEDFLSPLNQGLWEVIVPREEVTEPLGEEWKRIALNIPSPETIASYRNGQYHAHETELDYRVHMDRYNPAKNPLMHLVDDAPVVLMLYDTMDTLVVRAKETRTADYSDRFVDQNLTWKMRVATGAGLMVAGMLLLLFAIGYPGIFYAIFIPLFICAFGVVLIIAGYRYHGTSDVPLLALLRGPSSCRAGTLVVLERLCLPPEGDKEKGPIPQGIWITIGMGVGSLILGIFASANPLDLLRFLILLLAVLTLLGAVFSLLEGSDCGMPQS